MTSAPLRREDGHYLQAAGYLLILIFKGVPGGASGLFYFFPRKSGFKE